MLAARQATGRHSWNTEAVERPGAAFQAAWVLTAVVLAPVVEEIVFRGLIFQRLLRRVRPVLAALGSSLLFGLLHRDYLWSGLFGLAMVALYAQTRSLWVPIVAHALSNAVGTLAGGIWTVLVGKPLWLVIVTGIVCLPWLGWLLWRGLKELSPRSPIQFADPRATLCSRSAARPTAPAPSSAAR